MSTLNAAVTTPQRQGIKLAAATGVLGKKENPASVGDYVNFDTINRFNRYPQLIKSTPYASTGLKKLKTSLTKGMDFDGDSQADVDEFRSWSKKTNFIGQAQTVGGHLFMNGTFAGICSGNVDRLKLRPLLMGYTTILPEGVTSCSNPGTIMQPEAAQFIVNEGGLGQLKETSYPAENVVYGVIDEWDSIQLDIRNRTTCGLYGESLVDPIELSIRYLHIINQGYVEYVRKYGMGRYSYSFPFMEQCFEKGLMNWEQFKQEISTWMEENKYLGQNEDLVGIVKATPVDAMGSLDIMQFKKSLETDIQLGLLQSDISMGDSKGSTYAAGYVSENARMVVLDCLQQTERNVIQDFIDRRLVLLGKTPGSVEVIFDELSMPQMAASEVLEWANTGIIENDEAREWAGFPTSITSKWHEVA